VRRYDLLLRRNWLQEMGLRHTRMYGEGTEFERLREYLTDDEFWRIEWKATARRNRPVTIEYQTERSQTVMAVLDIGRMMQSPVARIAKLDYAVNAALSLGQVALGSGDRVGLLAYGRSVRQRLLPNRGSLHLRKLIEQLALVREEPGESDHLRAASVLLSTQSRRSLIVWITDLAETAMTPEVIEAAGSILSRHLVIFAVIGQPDLGTLAAKEPDSVSQMYLMAAAQEVMHRREILLARLRQRGALAVEVESGKASAAVVNSYLEAKERNLL